MNQHTSRTEPLRWAPRLRTAVVSCAGIAVAGVCVLATDRLRWQVDFFGALMALVFLAMLVLPLAGAASLVALASPRLRIGRVAAWVARAFVLCVAAGATLAVPCCVGLRRVNDEYAEARAWCERTADALESYRAAHGVYPSALAALATPPSPPALVSARGGYTVEGDSAVLWCRPPRSGKLSCEFERYRLPARRWDYDSGR